MEKDWVAQVQQRGWADALRVALDLLEPLGPFAAQVLYVMQPTASVFGLGTAAQEIAAALDEPGGIDALRARLDDPDNPAAHRE
jgi:long-subunit fatty acid transport protein